MKHTSSKYKLGKVRTLGSLCPGQYYMHTESNGPSCQCIRKVLEILPDDYNTLDINIKHQPIMRCGCTTRRLLEILCSSSGALVREVIGL